MTTKRAPGANGAAPAKQYLRVEDNIPVRVRELDLPSGKTALVRSMDPREMLRVGLIPRPFVAAVQPLTMMRKGMTARQTDALQKESDRRFSQLDWAEMAESISRLACALVLVPPAGFPDTVMLEEIDPDLCRNMYVMTKEEAIDNPGTVPIDRLAWDDQQAIYQEVMKVPATFPAGAV